MSTRAYLFAAMAIALIGCSDDPAPISASGSDTGSAIGADAGGGDGGGSDTGGDAAADTSTATQSCQTATVSGASVLGQVYVDEDRSERSLWDGGELGSTDTAMQGVTVQLIGADGVEEMATCDDGTFGFGDLDGAVYVTDVSFPEGAMCRTRNCARRFPDAVAEGRVKIVTLGDSVPVVGDAPFFPARLVDILAPVVVVESVNIAVGGTTSIDWVPGTSNFDNRLAPHIESADVIVVSIGGNDFLEYANGAFSNPSEAIAGFPDFVREVMDRVLWVKDEVQLRNPDCDLVYLLYPDYSQSDTWEAQFGLALPVIQPLVHDALEQLLNELEMDEDIIVVDFYGYFRENGLDLDDFLYDMLHFNSAGQTLYAEQIFEALGGVRLSDGLGAEQRFALEPQ